MASHESIAALHRAIEIIGSETKVAEAIGIKQQSVNDVVRNNRPAPPRWCIPLERATKGQITRHQLRPDLYPREESAA